MAEYRYYLIPDAMTRAFPEQFGKQTPTEFFDNIADLEKRYHQLREMPYNNERTWNERTRFPYARLVVGIDRQNPDGAVAIIQVRNGVNYLCDDYRGPYADRSDAHMSNYNDFDLDIRSTQNAGSVGPQSVPLTNFTCNCTTGVVCYATNLLCTPGNICDITMGCTDGCSEGCEPGEPSETHSYCGAACR